MKTASSLEPLESRVAPAGIVDITVSGGVVTVIGDGADNDFGVFPLEDGTTKVLATTGTTLRFEGTTDTLFTLPVSAPILIAKLGDGADHLSFSGSFRALNIDTGNGNDLINPNTVVVSGNSRILTGAGDDQVFAVTFSSQRFLGKLDIQLGAGADGVSLSGFDFSVARTFSISGGAGQDSFSTFCPLFVGGNLTVDFGANNGTLNLAGSLLRVIGKTSITASNGSQEAFNSSFNSITTDLQGGLAFTAGDGMMSLTFGGKRLEMGAGAQILTGKSTAFVQFINESVTIHGAIFAKSKGALNFGFTPSQEGSVTGSLTTKSGSGENSTTLTGVGSIGKSVSISSLTLGTASISGSYHIGQSVVVNFSQATAGSSFHLASAHVGGGLSVTGSAGADTITLNDTRVIGRTSITTGGGDDQVQIERDGGLIFTSIFAGPLKIVTGGGNDTLLVGSVPQHLLAFGAVSFNGGEGPDTLSFAPNGNLVYSTAVVAGFETGT